MRVLVLTGQFGVISGAERLAIELSIGLNARGVNADIGSLYANHLPGAKDVEGELRRKGVPTVHYLDMPIHPSISSVVKTISRVRKLIRENHYDIIETSVVSPAVVSALATLGTQTKHIMGIHQVFRRDRENRRQHKVWLASIRLNRNARYYAISDYVKQQWTKFSGVSPRLIRRVYNGVSDEFFHAPGDHLGVRRELGVPLDSRLALYVGRLAAYKGIDTLINALGPILAEKNLYLVCAGSPDLEIPGTQDMLKGITGLLSSSAWGRRVLLLGYRKDVARLMASANLLVHPSLTEGFGLTLVEALATGLPVISTNVEGIPEVLENTGAILVPPNDEMAIRGAVLYILSRTPKELADIIARGKQRAEVFRSSKRIDMMLTLFDDALNGRF